MSWKNDRSIPILAAQVIDAGQPASLPLHADRFLKERASALDRGNRPPINVYPRLRFALNKMVLSDFYGGFSKLTQLVLILYASGESGRLSRA